MTIRVYMPMIAWWKEFKNIKVSCISEWSASGSIPTLSPWCNADLEIQVYIVATNDRDLKRRIRKIPGVSVTKSFLPILRCVAKQN